MAYKGPFPTHNADFYEENPGESDMDRTPVSLTTLNYRCIERDELEQRRITENYSIQTRRR